MDDKQKIIVSKMRGEGYSYGKIASHMGISVNTIKTHCQRHGLGGSSCKGEGPFCEYCGEKVIQPFGRKKKRFCSDACRNRWWNKHQELVKRKAYTTLICRHCGKQVEVYGNRGRKYCSHACYIADRFGAR